MNNRVNSFLLYSVAIYAFPAVFFSANAMDETDAMNMSGRAVKIQNMYPGAWKGWSDGCINCDKPMSIERPSRKRKSKKKNQRTVPQNKAKLQSSGYCECSCNNSNLPAQRVFGAKPASKPKKQQNMLVRDPKNKESNESNKKNNANGMEAKSSSNGLIESKKTSQPKDQKAPAMKESESDSEKGKKLDDSKNSDGEKKGDPKRIFSLWS